MIIIVILILGLVVCIQWLNQSDRQRVTTSQEQVVKQHIARAGRDVDGKEKLRKEVKKKPEKMEVLEQQLIQVNDVKKKPEKLQVPVLGQQPVQVNDVKKKPEKMEGLGQQLVQVKDVKKKPEKIEGQQVRREEVPVMPHDRGNKAGKQPLSSLIKFSYNYVKLMTKNFDSVNVIGKGGFAQVYKGMLLNGTPVAVKRLNQLHTRVDDFTNEVDALGQTSHFNLVKLIGYCFEDEHKMLVYEYMRNGPLENWIFGTNPNKTLSWIEKKRIILGIAKGLVYLHENCEKKILHRDLKPQNVLLDDQKNAKLCDFGISKLLERDQSSTSTMGFFTPGYVAPEIMMGSRISEKVDVYSFGVVVLEVLFGKRYYRLISSNQTKLRANQLPGLITKLGDEMRGNGTEIERIGRLAVSCLSEEPRARPTMSDIVGAIRGADAQVGRY